MEGVSTKSNPHGFHGNDLRRRDIAQVHITADELDEIKLLGLLRSFPKDLLRRDLGEDLLYKTFAHFAAATVDAYFAGLTRFSNDIGSAGAQLSTLQLDPFIGRNDMFCILAAYLAQYDAMLGKLFDIAAFLGMGNGDGAITHFHMGNAIILTDRDIVFELSPYQESFEKCTAKIDG